MCSLATETRPRFLVELYTSARSVHTGQTVLLLPYLDLQVPTLINHLNRRTPAAADNTEIDERIAHLEPKDVESIQPRRKRRPIEREASLPGVNGQSQSRLQKQKDRTSSPCLRLTRHRIGYEALSHPPRKAARKLRQLSVASAGAGFEQRA